MNYKIFLMESAQFWEDFIMKNSIMLALFGKHSIIKTIEGNLHKSRIFASGYMGAIIIAIVTRNILSFSLFSLSPNWSDSPLSNCLLPVLPSV